MGNRICKSAVAAAALVVQCVAIGFLVWRYESVVRFGTEVRFRCEAYDPYDPLRGRYLRTTVREICADADGFKDFDKSFRGSDRFFVKVEPSTNGLWRVDAVALAPKDDDGLWVKPERVKFEHKVGHSDRKEGEDWKDFERRRERSPWVARVAFPSRLFVNEHIASSAEKVLADATSGKGKDAVAVYRAKDGKIVLTDIEIDGKSVTSLAREARAREISQ